MLVLPLISTELSSDELGRSSHIRGFGIRAHRRVLYLSLLSCGEAKHLWFLASCIPSFNEVLSFSLWTLTSFKTSVQCAIFSYLFTAVKQDFIQGTLILDNSQLLLQPSVEQGISHTSVWPYSVDSEHYFLIL